MNRLVNGILTAISCQGEIPYQNAQVVKFLKTTVLGSPDSEKYSVNGEFNFLKHGVQFGKVSK